MNHVRTEQKSSAHIQGYMVHVQIFGMDTNIALPGESCVADGKDASRTSWKEMWLDKETGSMKKMAQSPQQVKCFCLYFESSNPSPPGTSTILQRQLFSFAIPKWGLTVQDSRQ